MKIGGVFSCRLAFIYECGQVTRMRTMSTRAGNDHQVLEATTLPFWNSRTTWRLTMNKGIEYLSMLIGLRHVAHAVLSLSDDVRLYVVGDRL